jgi:hypothetical protein
MDINKTFFEQTKAVRKAQKLYYDTRLETDLKTSKEQERKLDMLIKSIDKLLDYGMITPK